MKTETKAAEAKPKTTSTICEYRPFGSQDIIKLSVPIVRGMLSKPTTKGAVPTDADVYRFIMLCKARALNPFEGDAFLVGYDGRQGPEFSLITAHQAFLKRAEGHPDFDGMDSGVIVLTPDGETAELEGDFIPAGCTLLGGWATVYRKKQSHPRKSKLNLAARKKDNRFWNQDPGGMICKCAEADALRASFPNSLAGMYLAEERIEDAREFAPALPEPRQNGSKTAALADRMGAAPEAEAAQEGCDGFHEAPACHRNCWRVEEMGESWPVEVGVSE